MTDIVERLRAFDTRKMDAWAVCEEAADEIERLREALRKIASTGQSIEPDHWAFRCAARKIARAALGEKE